MKFLILQINYDIDVYVYVHVGVDVVEKLEVEHEVIVIRSVIMAAVLMKLFTVFYHA